MTHTPVSDLEGMLAGMEPELDAWPHEISKLSSLGFLALLPWFFLRQFAFVFEKEGITSIRPVTTAAKGPLFARITLNVYSDLEGVGLTAAVASTLAKSGIACNVIAAFHHDHIFVPWDRREESLELLRQLSFDARR